MEGNRRYLCDPLMEQQNNTKPKVNVVGCILQILSAYEEEIRELALTKAEVLAKMDERSKALLSLLDLG